MIKSIASSMILLIGICLYTTPVSSITPDEKKLISLLKRYSPTGHYIVTQALSLPETFYIGNSRKYSRKIKTIKLNVMRFRGASRLKSILGEKTSQETGLVLDLNFMVHETCHFYTLWNARAKMRKNGLIKSKDYYDIGLFYIGGKENIFIRTSKVFPTKEIVSSIPEELRTFRFPKYVNSKQKYLSTQVRGIYGLLNEFNAYYHGVKASYDSLKWYKKQKHQTISHWSDFFNGVNPSLYAYQEFKFFIITYLIYAEKKHPETYKVIMENKKFRKALKKIDTNWSKLVSSYSNKKISLFKYIKKKGIIVTENKEYIKLRKTNDQNSFVQHKNFNDVYAMLEKELKRKKYKKIRRELGI